MPKVPNKPAASPDSSDIELSVTVTLTVTGESDIYYRLHDDTAGTEVRYTTPITLDSKDSKYENIYLYAFSRVVVDGVNYGSEIAEYVYTPSGETSPPTRQCPMTYDPALDDDLTHNTSIVFNIQDKDNNGYFEDRISCSYESDSGLITSEKPIIDNQYHGIVKYYTLGKLSIYQPYVNGERHGTYISYWTETGNILSEKPYVNDKLHGISKRWSNTGILLSEQSYVNGILHGLSKAYSSSSGELLREMPFVDGKQHGTVINYGPGQIIIMERPYVNGKRHGTEKHYDYQGQLTAEYPYVDGVRHGKQLDYDDGKITRCTLYENGTAIGDCMT